MEITDQQLQRHNQFKLEVQAQKRQFRNDLNNLEDSYKSQIEAMNDETEKIKDAHFKEMEATRKIFEVELQEWKTNVQNMQSILNEVEITHKAVVYNLNLRHGQEIQDKTDEVQSASEKYTSMLSQEKQTQQENELRFQRDLQQV